MLAFVWEANRILISSAIAALLLIDILSQQLTVPALDLGARLRGRTATHESGK